MNFRDFRVLFLFEWKNKHNAAATVRSINAAFGNGLVNEVPFDVGMQSSKLRIRVSQTKAPTNG